jgi:hypothetical protein
VWLCLKYEMDILIEEQGNEPEVTTQTRPSDDVWTGYRR